MMCTGSCRSKTMAHGLWTESPVHGIGGMTWSGSKHPNETRVPVQKHDQHGQSGYSLGVVIREGEIVGHGDETRRRQTLLQTPSTGAGGQTREWKNWKNNGRGGKTPHQFWPVGAKTGKITLSSRKYIKRRPCPARPSPTLF